MLCFFACSSLGSLLCSPPGPLSPVPTTLPPASPGLWACPSRSDLAPSPGPPGLSTPLPPAAWPQADPSPGRAAVAGSGRNVVCVSLAKQNWPCLGDQGSAPAGLPLFRLSPEGGCHRPGGSPSLWGQPRGTDGQHEEDQGILRVKDPEHRLTMPAGSALPPHLAPRSPTLARLGGGGPHHKALCVPPDLPVVCLVPREPSTAAPTSGARGRRGQLGPLRALSQASAGAVGPGARRAGGRGGTRVGRWGPGHPRGVAL